MNWIWTRDESGQGIIEYALIFALMALVVIAALTFIGTSVGNVFSNLITNF